MFRKLFVASAFMALTGTFAVLSAQQDNAAAEKANSDRSAATKAHSPDHMFATCVATGNQEEIILAEVGRERASDEDVKKFAEMMITEHHTYLMKLKKFAPEATQAGWLKSHSKEAHAADAKDNAKSEIKQTAAAEDAAKDRVENAAGTSEKGIDFLALEREMANECLAISKEKLEGKLGTEFDQCFMGEQLAMHMAMKAKLTVFQRHASGEFAGILAEGLKATDTHLAKAEEIMKELGHHPTVVEKTREGKNKERKVIKEKD